MTTQKLAFAAGIVAIVLAAAWIALEGCGAAPTGAINGDVPEEDKGMGVGQVGAPPNASEAGLTRHVEAIRLPVLAGSAENHCRLQVVDGRDVPVTGARIQTARYGEPIELIGTSDEMGLVDLPEQAWGLSAAVAHERYQPSFLQLPSQPGSYSLKLEPGTPVSVQVSCAGLPVAGASVRLASGRVPHTWRQGSDQILPSGIGGVVMWRDTDARGFVCFTNMPPGAYSVVAAKAGYTCHDHQHRKVELPGSAWVTIEMEQLWGAIVDLGEEALELSFHYEGLDVLPQETISLRQQFEDAEIVVAGARRGNDHGAVSATYYGVKSGAWMQANTAFSWLREPKMSVVDPIRGEPIGPPGMLSLRVFFRGRELEGMRFSLLRDGGARSYAVSGKPRRLIPGAYQVESSKYGNVVGFDVTSVTVNSGLATELRGIVKQGLVPLRIEVPAAALDPNGCVVKVTCGQHQEGDVYDAGRWYMLPGPADLTVEVDRYGMGKFERRYAWNEWQERAGDVLTVEAP